MNYAAALSDFFKSPKWLNNLLLGGVCMIIPFVGPVALMGWHVTGFWGRKDADDMETYPAFDFANFTKYLQRGVWPFLTSIVLSVAIMPVMMIAMVIFVSSIVAAQHGHPHGQPVGDVFPIALFAVIGILFMGLNLIVMILMQPLRVMGALAQDFVPAFNWRRIKQFIALTWVEMTVSVLFVWLIAMMLALAGMVALVVGMYFTLSITQFMIIHLDAQLYKLYLERGGEPIPASPKLRDGPPPLPPSLPA